jgi:hypothetical protein
VAQEEVVRCGGAGGARNWRGGAAEVADGGGQWSSGNVVERRRKKNRNAGAREGIEEGRSSLDAFQRQKEVRRRVERSCWRSTACVAVRAGSGATCPHEEELAGLGERRAGELGGQVAQEQ